MTSYGANCSFSALLRVVGASNVTLQGINVTGTTGAGIGIYGSNGVIIADCVIDNHLEGVIVWPASDTKSRDIALLRNRIGYTGMEGAKLWGGNRSTLVPSGFLVENNRFHHFGLWTYTYQPGVSAGGVGTVIRKNEFSMAYHAAILYSGNDHVIELNDIHHVTSIA